MILALFNLLPGLPLDGGLILKALVWQVSGSQRKGTQVATATGRFLSLLAIGLGVVLLLRGAGVGGLWLMLLGWFGLGAARSQSQLLALQAALRQLNVKDAAQRRFRVLEADANLKQLSRLRLSDGDGLPDWLLVTRQGRWLGLITDAPLQELPVQRWEQELVGITSNRSINCPRSKRALRSGKRCCGSINPTRLASWCSVPQACPAARLSGLSWRSGCSRSWACVCPHRFWRRRGARGVSVGHGLGSGGPQHRSERGRLSCRRAYPTAAPGSSARMALHSSGLRG